MLLNGDNHISSFVTAPVYRDFFRPKDIATHFPVQGENSHPPGDFKT
jgi:hypothetical protein